MSKNALITGASKRIGREIALFFAEKGWNIILHYNNSGEAATALMKILHTKFGNQQFNVLRADLSENDEVSKLIPESVLQMGTLDLLINNASVFKSGSIKNSSVDLFEEHINVNLKAPFILMRDFAKLCKKGNIINIVDTRIVSNKSEYTAYSLSKKALWELTKMAALEFAPNIRVNAVAPGATLPPAGESESYLEKLAEKIPMKNAGGVESILKSIDFILNNEYLTGQLLFADGGENLGTTS